MSIQSIHYQQNTIQAVRQMLDRDGRALVVQPDGIDRRSLVEQLCQGRPEGRVLWLAPERPRPEGAIHTLSYPELAALEPGQWLELARLAPDTLVLEDFHRVGSGSWAEALTDLLELCPGVRVLGLTSVPVREWKQQPCLADELFEGQLAAELSLGEAVAFGLLPAPAYTVLLAPEQPMMQRLRGNTKSLRVGGGPEPIREQVEGLRCALEAQPSFGQLAAQAVSRRNGLYLAVCADEAQRQMVMPRIKEWLALVNPRVEAFRAGAADMPTAQDPESKGMKLVFCTPENAVLARTGYDGALLFRRGQAPELYRRQLNCALAACRGPRTEILDVLWDLEAMEDVKLLKNSVAAALRQLRAAGAAVLPMEKLELYEPLKDQRKRYQQLRRDLDAGWDAAYEQARAYRLANGTLEMPRKVMVGDELDLSAWLAAQRHVRSGRRPGYLTPKQIARLDELGIHWPGAGERTWERGCQAAQRYRAKHGDLLVPVRYRTEDGFNLGEWIVYNRQRRQADMLPPDRVDRLQSLGMVWDTSARLWDHNYCAAIRYYLEHGDLEVPVKYVSPDGVALGSWLGGQRAAYKAGELTPDQIARMDVLGVDWTDRNNRKWQTAYESAVRYYQEHGDLNVPSEYVDEDGVLLGKWISRQRYAHLNPDRSSARLTPERRRLLDEIGMQWGKAEPWQEHYRMAMEYREQHGGSLRMPAAYKTSEGVWLGTWLCRQRAALRADKPMTPERRRMLEELFAGEKAKRAAHAHPKGARREQNWQQNYRRAKAYYKAHGNLLVPASYVDETGCRLGVWISNLRAARKKRPDSSQVTPQHIALLDEIGMEWDARTAKWEWAYARAAEYHAAHGSLLVPMNYKTEDGFCLGDWVRRMRDARQRQDPKLTETRIQRLSALGMVWETD